LGPLHRPAAEIGLYYLAVIGGVPMGSFMSNRLAPRVRLTSLLRATSGIAVLGAVLFFVVSATGMLSVASVLGTMITLSIGVGASAPIAITGAISTDPQTIRAAAGLYGFVQMANGALCTLAVGFFPGNPALTAASVLLVSLLLGQCSFLLATRSRPVAGTSRD